MAGRPISEMIGKYRVLDRLGRGGMGTVLKAHDPVLDRVVALKVISSEIEVTDELRARFFREAQAGARLSHPNIVTVHDLADADGRLVIVMEFLDGDELRHIIAQRRPIGLEEKLGIMIQVCDGLGYAHHRGIVHRDIKPGNIFVLRDGSAKILDFGVARIVTAETGLTRTGLIMGTLRYMAPEQARGRADHRSDIFAVGTVFYELIAYRPAFPGDDPMEILEALRTHDPPLLNEVDPAIPPDLADLISRALHKDPEQRIQDLSEMRQELDSIRRRVLTSLDAARQRVRSRLDQVRELQASVVKELGDGVDDETLPIPHAGGLATLAAIEQNAVNKIARLTALLESAARFQSTLEQGVELLAAGDFDGVIAAIEPIVREVPEHARARRVLAEARSRLDEERRKALEQAAARAQQSRDVMDRARAAAEEVDAALLAAVTWQAAEMRSASGDAAVAQQDYALATGLFDDACNLYQQAGTEAGEIRRQNAQRDADAAGRDLARIRDVAVGCNAEHYAPAIWRAAVTKEALGNENLARQDFAAAYASFAGAREHYERAVDIARQERTREDRDGAERARAEAERVREIAQQAEAGIHANPTWTTAEQVRAEGEALISQGVYSEAASRFTNAASLYRSASDESHTAVRILRQRKAEAARIHAVERRRLAEEAGAPRDADRLWALAEEAAALGRAAADRSDFIQASLAFERASRSFTEAELAAREVARQRAALAEQADATQLASPISRELKQTTGAAGPVSPSPVHETRPARDAVATAVVRRPARRRSRTLAAGGVALGLIVLGVGGRWFYRREPPPEPASSSVAARTPSRASISELQQRVADARKTAEDAAAGRIAPLSFQAAVEAESLAIASLAANELAPAEQRFTQALAAFSEAAKAALQQQAADIAELRTRVAAVRQAADQAGASRRASALMKAAQDRELQAEAAFGQADFNGAAAALRDAERQYRHTLQVITAAPPPKEPDIKHPARDQQKTLDEVRRAAAGAREFAVRSDANTIAKEPFDSATRRWNQGESETSLGNLTAAIQSFSEAGRIYRDADRLARERRTLRHDAETGRERAKGAGADFLAKDLFDAGSARLDEAERLARAQNWSGAARAYAGAVRQYAEAERRVQDIDKVRGEAEKTKERREQARLAGAEGFAKELFDAAAARHVEADRLARGADVTAAIPAYREAAQRYADAEKRARETRRN